MKMVYLDNNATTPVAPEVLEVMMQVAREGFANPGSRHSAGRKARQLLEEAREQIAERLDAEPGEVVFTSGGTESSNLAIDGLTYGRTGRIVLPPGEHPATEEPVKRLHRRGCVPFKLALSESGQITEESLVCIPWDETILATCLYAHNETGTLVNFGSLASACEQHRIPLHLDAVQAVGKVPVSFRNTQAATMSVAAHKFSGPRGIGALLIREGVKVIPQQVGGHQEGRRRAGTESVMLAVGMAKALQLCDEQRSERTAHLVTLRDQLQDGLTRTCSPVVINGDVTSRLPNTLNISFPGCDADALLVAFDLAGVCCSHGSACASGSSEPAPILVGMHCPPDVYRSAIRFSVGVQNTADEIEQAISIVSEIVLRLRKRS